MEFESQAHKVQLRRDLQCMHRGQCYVSVHMCVCGGALLCTKALMANRGQKLYYCLYVWKAVP